MNNYKVAGFWVQFLSYALDIFIFMIISILLKIYIFYNFNLIYMKVINIALFISYAAYYYAMIMSKWQATIGMKILGIKWVDQNGNRVSSIYQLIGSRRNEASLVIDNKK